MAEAPKLRVVGGTTAGSNGSGASVPPGGGSGSGGGNMPSDIDAKVSTLQSSFEKLEGKLDKISSDTSYLKGKVDAMPTTLQLLAFVIAVLGIAGLAKYLA